MKKIDTKTGLLLTASLLLLSLLAACQDRPQKSPPTVDTADPAFLVQGASNHDVTVQGDGFEPGSQVRFLVSGREESGGVTVNSTRFVDPNTLVTNVDVAADAATGSFDVEVEAGGRTGKGIQVFGVAPNEDAEP